VRSFAVVIGVSPEMVKETLQNADVNHCAAQMRAM